MSWTDVATFTAGELVTAAKMESLSDNARYLLDPNKEIDDYSGGGVSTSSDTFADIDSTNLSITLTTNGGPVLLVFMAAMRNVDAAQGCAFDFTVDTTRQGAGSDYGLLYGESALSNLNVPITMVYLTDSLSAGSHTFRPQFRRVGTGTARVKADTTSESQATFFAIEL